MSPFGRRARIPCARHHHQLEFCRTLYFARVARSFHRTVCVCVCPRPTWQAGWSRTYETSYSPPPLQPIHARHLHTSTTKTCGFLLVPQGGRRSEAGEARRPALPGGPIEGRPVHLLLHEHPRHRVQAQVLRGARVFPGVPWFRKATRWEKPGGGCTVAVFRLSSWLAASVSSLPDRSLASKRGTFCFAQKMMGLGVLGVGLLESREEVMVVSLPVSGLLLLFGVGLESRGEES